MQDMRNRVCASQKTKVSINLFCGATSVNKIVSFSSFVLLLSLTSFSQSEADSCSYIYNNDYQLGKIKSDWNSTEWKANGFKKNEAIRWANCGFGPKGAYVWKDNGGTPVESALLRESGFNYTNISGFNEKLEKYCGGKFFISLQKNPYKAKNRCFFVGGNVQQILSKNISLINSSGVNFIAYFMKNKFSPGSGVSFFGFGIGSNPFKYKAVDGEYKVVPVIDYITEKRNSKTMSESQQSKNFNYMFGH